MRARISLRCIPSCSSVFLALVRVIHSFILHQIISSSFQIQILYLRMIVIVALDVNSALVISSIDRIGVASANDN